MANPKRPRDTNQLAKMIVDLTTGDESEPEMNVKQKAGQKDGLKGGKARADRLTPDERSAIGKKAAERRWSEIIRRLSAYSIAHEYALPYRSR